MRRAIGDLVQLSDDRFLEEISKGIGHIVEYADSLDLLAGRLVDIDEYRGAKTVHALADEEAAKVLILVDAVRCPPSEKRHRSRTLRGYYVTRRSPSSTSRGIDDTCRAFHRRACVALVPAEAFD